jgi:CRISPR-associated endoribonuclease Cas6
MTEKHLYAIVLRLAAIRPGALPANHGDSVRAALLNLIRKGDSPLAQQLHDDNSAKPYAISLVDGGKRGPDGAQHFGEGDRADWRFSLMMQPAFEALLQKYLLNNQLPHVRIGSINFAIVDAFVSHTAHVDSGHISISELTEGWQRHPAEQLPKHIVFDFQSPTVFSLGQNKETKAYRFRSHPDAKTMFSSLRKRWVKLEGVDAGDEFDDWIDKNIEQEIIEIQMKKLHLENRTISGFTGQVAYQHYGADTRWLRYWNLLADLTFWTGVGYQTTRGMGQVRRLLMDRSE